MGEKRTDAMKLTKAQNAEREAALADLRETLKPGTKAQNAEREAALADLRETLKPGDTLYTINRHVSSSGMRRSISVVRAVHDVHDGERLVIDTLDLWVSRVLRERIDQKHGGIYQTGCGMDMGFHLVYNLGRYLWPDGTPEPHGKRNGTPDRDGGYALKQRWL
jgi:hypothetical protein